MKRNKNMNVKRTTLGFVGLSGCGKTRLLGTWPGDEPLVILDYEHGCQQVLGDAADYIKKSEWDTCKTYDEYATLFQKSGKKLVVVNHLSAWELLSWAHQVFEITGLGTDAEVKFAVAIDTVSTVTNSWFKDKVQKTPDVSRVKSGKFSTPSGENEIQPAPSDFNHAKMYMLTFFEALQKCRTTGLVTFHAVPIIKKVPDGAGGILEINDGWRLEGPGSSVAEAAPKFLDGLIRLTRKGVDGPTAEYTPNSEFKKLKIRTPKELSGKPIPNATLTDILKLQTN